MDSVNLPPQQTLLERIKPVEREFRAFLKALPALLAEGQEGRHVLIKDDEVISTWDTFEDGYQAGSQQYGFGVQFLVQPIDPRYLDFPWPEEILPRERKSA